MGPAASRPRVAGSICKSWRRGARVGTARCLAKRPAPGEDLRLPLGHQQAPRTGTLLRSTTSDVRGMSLQESHGNAGWLSREPYYGRTTPNRKSKRSRTST